METIRERLVGMATDEGFETQDTSDHEMIVLILEVLVEKIKTQDGHTHSIRIF